MQSNMSHTPSPTLLLTQREDLVILERNGEAAPKLLQTTLLDSLESWMAW